MTGAAAFGFDPDTHTYTIDDRPVPSVTQVLDEAGIAPDLSFLDDYYLRRGSAIHQAIRLHLYGRLDWNSLDDNVRPFVEHAANFAETLGIEPRVIEHRAVCPTYRYGGTLDLFCDSNLGPLFIDWKAVIYDPAFDIQVAGGYVPLLEQSAADGAIAADVEEVRRARVAVVPLKPELPKPHWVSKNGMVEIFRAALAVVHWRRAYRKGKR